MMKIEIQILTSAVCWFDAYCRSPCLTEYPCFAVRSLIKTEFGDLSNNFGHVPILDGRKAVAFVNSMVGVNTGKILIIKCAFDVEVYRTSKLPNKKF